MAEPAYSGARVVRRHVFDVAVYFAYSHDRPLLEGQNDEADPFHPLRTAVSESRMVLKILLVLATKKWDVIDAALREPPLEWYTRRLP